MAWVEWGFILGAAAFTALLARLILQHLRGGVGGPFKAPVTALNVLFFSSIVLGAMALLGTGARAEEAAAAIAGGDLGESIRRGLGYVGMGIATGCAAIGAGIGAGIAGAAGIGAISEKPGMLARTLIYVGLAEGAAIYGLLISFIIMNKI